MECDELIIRDVKLYANEIYFPIFSKILLNLGENIFVYTLKKSVFEVRDKKKEKITSLWSYIMRVILNKLKEKEKIKFSKNDLNINNLVFSYLLKISNKIIAKLIKISIITKKSLLNVIKIYII